MKPFLSCILLACCTTLGAQTGDFVGNLRSVENGKGMVTVVQSQEITDLVNGKIKEPERVTLVEPQKDTNTPSTQQHTATKPATTTPSTAQHHDTPSASQQNASKPAAAQTAEPSTTDEPVVDTRKKVMRKSYKTTGYRIQVFSGGNSRMDRMKAETAGATMKSNFPNEPIYVHFYSPSWKCRMGNYKSLEEARGILKQVKSLGYNQACIVKGQISVQY